MLQAPKILRQTSSIPGQNLLSPRQEYGNSEKLPHIPSSPKTISIQIPIKTREPVLTQRTQETARSINESPKGRIVFMGVDKSSDIGFGVMSGLTDDVVPLEPLSKAIRDEKSQLGMTRFSPKHALLYKKDGIDILSCNFNKAIRDESCHSLEVTRNDLDDFCGEVISPMLARRNKHMKPKAAVHRRRISCLCSWCGGASAFEKAIQNHPSVPSTVCQRHQANRDESETSKSIASEANSRKNSWNGRLNISRRMKKSTFGTTIQGSMVLDVSPRPSVRSARRPSTLIMTPPKEFLALKPRTEDNKQQSSLQKISVIPLKAEADDTKSQGSDCSINLEEPPSFPIWRSRTSVDKIKTFVNFRTKLSPEKISSTKQIYNFGASVKGMEKPLKESMTERKETIQTQDTSGDLEVQRSHRCSAKPRKISVNQKRREKKSVAKTTCHLKNVYSCAPSPKNESIFQKRQPISGILFNTKKTSSSISWGLELAKGPSSPIQEEPDLINCYNKQEIKPKHKKNAMSSTIIFPKPMKPNKALPSIWSSVNSVETLKATYLSPKSKTIMIPPVRMVNSKKRITTVY